MLEIDILHLISNLVYRLVKSDYIVKLITINFSDIFNNRYTNHQQSLFFSQYIILVVSHIS